MEHPYGGTQREGLNQPARQHLLATLTPISSACKPFLNKKLLLSPFQCPFTCNNRHPF